MRRASTIPCTRSAIMVYGKSGVGKTHFCCTCPAPLLLTTERKEPITVNRYCAEHKTDIPVYDADDYRRADDLLSAFELAYKKPGKEVTVRGEENTSIVYFDVSNMFEVTFKEERVGEEDVDITIPVQTLVVDGLTELYTLILEDVQKHNGTTGKAPQIQEWGQAHNLMKSFVYRAKALPIHFVATALELLTKDEVIGSIEGGADLPGKMQGQITKMFNAVARAMASHSRDKTNYRLVVKADHRFPAKCEFKKHETNEVEATFAALWGEEG